MNRRDTSPATSTDKEVRNARIITTFLTVFMAIVTVYFFSQGADTATSLKAYLITMTLGSAVAGWLTYKRQVQWGIPILVATFWLLLIFNQFTSAGDGLLNGLVAAVVTAGIAFPTMSGKRLNRIISFGVAIGVTVVFIDIFGPADRPVYENTSFDYVFIASLTGALVYFLGRQLREANLRPKLIASYAFIAVIGAVFAYGSTQLATQRLSQDAVPSLQAFAHVAQESHTVQAEALEYVSLGEDETIEQLDASAAELATLAAQLPELANDEEEVRDFTALADKANEAGNLAQAVAGSHSQTLAAIESMETAEAEMLVLFEQAQAVVDAEIARNIASGDLAELENDSIPSQLFFADFSFNTQLMLAETLEFVTTGEPDAAADFEVTQGQLAATLAELASVLEADEPGEGDLAAQLAENAATITAAGRSVIAAHENTLELLDQLEALEAELDINLANVEQLIEQDVSAGESTSSNVVILATVVALVISGGMGVLMSSTVVEPVSRLVVAAQKLGSGDLSAQAHVETKDEIGTLASTFNNMAVQLRQTLGQLDRRARQMETSSEVSRRLSTILDENELVTAVVTSLQEAFNYYHVHIYMLDKAENKLVMAGGTGKAGAQLLAQKHALAIGRGLVGTAALANVTNLVPDVTANEDWVANPLLPDTRAEIAVPIALGNEVLGVLDVQSNVTQGLGELDQELLQSITSQVAIALQNARQYEEVQRSQKSLQERETLMRTIIDSTPDWIFAKDKNHRYMVVNKEFADTLQLTPDEIVGKNDLEIGIPEMVVNGDPEKGIPGVWPGERKVMDGGEMVVIEEETTIATTGRHMYMTTTRVPLKDAGGSVTGIVGFIHDITER